MILNNDQQIILNQLKDFILNDSKNKFFLLTGLAGTGKTFLITYLLSLPEFINKKIAVTGCTNKAVGVLTSSFENNKNNHTNNINATTDNIEYNLDFLTIHKLLQIKRKIGSKGEEIFESTIDENNIKIKAKSIFYYNIIVVDEVSMLNKDMVLQLLRLQNKINGKVIFLGDKAQLPPVRESESHIFELANTKIPHSALTKIMRSGDQIINFVNSIRQLIDDPNHKVPFKKLSNIPTNETTSRITIFRNEEDWIQKYLQNKEQTEQIILCYTNRRVDYLNKKIRKALFKTELNNFVNGEKIIFNNAYFLESNQFKYDSSQMVNISTSTVDTITINPFNIYDIINPKFPISAIYSQLSKNKIKYKIPNMASKAYEIEKNNVVLSDVICQICYDADDTGDKICFSNCGHHYCNKCYYSWELNITKSLCPLCILTIKNNKIIVKDDPQLTKLFEDLRNIGFIEETQNQTQTQKQSKKELKYIIWLIMLENKDLLYVIHQDDKERYNNHLEKIKDTLKNINHHITHNYKQYLVFWDKIMLQLWDFYYYFYIDQFAQVNYGNAITTHRSQGSTYKRVYVDLIDIIKCNDVKKEGFQCLYTAVTRASENLEILL